MRLKFKAPYLSIKQLESIDLPLFTLLTGLNGSGKTHVLRAIEQEKIIIEGISQNRIKFFSYLDFKVAEGSLNSQQIEQQTTQAWQILSGSQGQSKVNWLNQAMSYYNQSFPASENNELNLNFFDTNKQMYKSENINVRAYINKIQNHIFENNIFKQNQYSSSIIKAIKKINKPLHLISKEEFSRAFIPSIPNDNHLSIRLGAVFTKYKTDQFNWIHEEWDKRNINIDKATEAHILNLQDFENKKDLYFFKVSEKIRSKKDFANLVSSFESQKFNNFKPLLNKINEIIEL